MRAVKLILAAAMVAFTGCDILTPSKDSPQPDKLRIEGPTSMVLGDEANFTATLVKGNGEEVDVTHEVEWQPIDKGYLNSGLLLLIDKGVVRAIKDGSTGLRASLGVVNGGIGVEVTPYFAKPPEDVSWQTWKVAFSGVKLQLFRPDALHFVLPKGTDMLTFETFEWAASEIVRNTQGKTPISVGFDPDRAEGVANFQVSMMPEPGTLICGSFGGAGACTSTGVDYMTGKVIGGLVKFDSYLDITSRLVVMHEMLWALGLSHHANQLPGITNPIAIPNGGTESHPAPTEEEVRMLLARYELPLLARYAQ